MTPQRRKQGISASKSSGTNGRRLPRVFMPRRRNVELAEEAGQILIGGVAGASLSSEERSWFQRIRPGGIILFRRNIEEASRSSAKPTASARRPFSAASISRAAWLTASAT
jgi:hypothetical protein